MKIIVGSDHGGYELKEKIIKFLKKEKYKVENFGTHSKESCNYPLIGFEVAKAVASGMASRGILICRSGVGMTIVANKVHGIRAAACYDKITAKSSREHNDCNVLVLAADRTNFRKAKELVKIWLITKHVGERHGRRIRQIKEIESKLKGAG